MNPPGKKSKVLKNIAALFNKKNLDRAVLNLAKTAVCKTNAGTAYMRSLQFYKKIGCFRLLKFSTSGIADHIFGIA